MGKKSIFISHSSKDKEFVRMLNLHLSEYGVLTWLDENELALGDFLTKKISRAIEDADYLGIVLSSNSINSDWVKMELETALHKEIIKHKKIVIPILLEKIELPDSIRDRIYADFTDRGIYHRNFHQLLGLLGFKPEIKDRLCIFDDSWGFGWENWSWDCDFDEKATKYVFSGEYCIRAKLHGYGGLAFAFRSGIDTRGFNNIEFYINGGDFGGQRLKVYVNDRIGNGIKRPVVIPRLTRGKWDHIIISLDELEAKDTIIAKLNLSDVSGKDSPDFYLDNISLLR